MSWLSEFGDDLERFGDDILGRGEGKGGGESEHSKTLARIAEEYYGQTGAIRDPMIDQFADFMEGGFDPSSTPMYGAGKYALETQYGRAKENIMANLPQGGSLLDALAGADISKAGDMATMMGGISQDVYNKAYGMATGAPQVSISGLGQLAGGEAIAAGQESAAKTGAMGDIGMSLALLAK